ncbi:MAG: hypothetical protein RI580_10780 [Halothece sp. Uz-M2-17]|nr:hypothetical protein [Halothece sp. Uz-M2-17]
MKAKEIKLLLKLLGEDGYQANVKSIKPTVKTPISECNRICYQLHDQNLIEIIESEIAKIKITASGKALLNIDPSELPITKKEFKILNACAEKSMFLKEIQVSPKTKLVQILVERGFLTITQSIPKKITLSENGKTFLAQEFNPSGTNSVLSLDMLRNYLNFLRNYKLTPTIDQQSPVNENEKLYHNLSDEEVLEVIIQLDEEYNMNNFLPIFYLRKQLQPPLTREELDQVLYRLQANNQIQLSSITETEGYTSEQLKAGISQRIGGSLFFIQVNHERA